jgi:hypothetical protein
LSRECVPPGGLVPPGAEFRLLPVKPAGSQGIRKEDVPAGVPWTPRDLASREAELPLPRDQLAGSVQTNPRGAEAVPRDRFAQVRSNKQKEQGGSAMRPLFRSTVLLTVGWAVLFSARVQAQGPTNVNMTVTNNATINWLWATQYLARAGSAGNGTVSGHTNDWIDSGSNATVQANANANYHFTYWTGVPAAVTNSNPAAFAMDTFYTNILAYFALDMKTVTVYTAFGTPLPAATNVVPYGTNFNVTVTPLIVTQQTDRIRVRIKGVNVTGNDYTVSP